MTVKEKQLVKKIKTMREFMETQISHAKAQTKRFEKLGDHESAMDWFNIGRGAEKILKEYNETFATELEQD